MFYFSMSELSVWNLRNGLLFIMQTNLKMSIADSSNTLERDVDSDQNI